MSAMPHESHTEPTQVDYLAELEQLAADPGFPVEAVLARLRRTGTCPVCGKTVVVVNYGLERHGEVGYLGRHGRPGVRAGAKCRGSFGGWVERKRSLENVRRLFGDKVWVVEQEDMDAIAASLEDDAPAPGLVAMLNRVCEQRKREGGSS